MDRLADEIRSELARFGPQAGMPELLERWPPAVGVAIASHAWPARIGKDGTVHVNTSDSIWAFELAQRGREIAERLGVRRIRFAPGPLPERVEETRPPVLAPTAEEEREAQVLAARIADEKLRETVQKALRLALAQGRRDRPF
jgi:hypothetical protein